jgi:hypothetical protein
MTIHIGGAVAQTVAPGADSPVASKPLTAGETYKTPNVIPEIIRRPDGSDNVSRSAAAVDPVSVLRPPTVSLEFLRAIRLDWDRLGDQRDAGMK